METNYMPQQEKCAQGESHLVAAPFKFSKPKYISSLHGSICFRSSRLDERSLIASLVLMLGKNSFNEKSFDFKAIILVC